MANVTAEGNTSNTLSVDELLTDVLESYKTQFPVIGQFSTDFSSETARKGQSIIARILSAPTVADFNGNYSKQGNGTVEAQSAGSLTKDLAITLNQHKHVPVKMDYADLIATRRDLYGEMVAELSHALGKDLMANVWNLCGAGNFSEGVTAGGATVALSDLLNVRQRLNEKGASVNGRFGIVSSAVMSDLLADDKIASNDYYGQLSGSSGLGVLNNIAGFEAIYEYVTTDENDADVVGFFGDKSAINIAGRVPQDFNEQASRANAPAIASSTIVADPSSGMSMMGITYQEAGTFDIYTSLTHIYGLRAGNNGGSVGDGTDFSGVLFKHA